MDLKHKLWCSVWKHHSVIMFSIMGDLRTHLTSYIYLLLWHTISDVNHSLLPHSHSASCWYKLFKVFIRFLQGFFGKIFQAIAFLSPVLEKQREKSMSIHWKYVCVWTCIQIFLSHHSNGKAYIQFAPLEQCWEGLKTN